jgi:hypothetical protein
MAADMKDRLLAVLLAYFNETSFFEVVHGDPSMCVVDGHYDFTELAEMLAEEASKPHA